MLNMPNLETLLRCLNPNQIPAIKQGLLEIKYPSRVKGIRFNVEVDDLLEGNQRRIDQGLMIFEQIRPSGTTRLMSLPNVWKGADIDNAFELIKFSMSVAGTKPCQWQYQLNEAWQPCFGLTPLQACESAVLWRKKLNANGCATRKLYLCYAGIPKWDNYDRLPFPRDLHFYHDKDDPNHLHFGIIKAEQCCAKHSDIICTEAGRVESDTQWGNWTCHDWRTATIPLRSVIALAYKYSHDVAYHTLFDQQTLQPPAGEGGSIGLWSNSDKQDTPRVNPILDWMKKGL